MNENKPNRATRPGLSAKAEALPIFSTAFMRLHIRAVAYNNFVLDPKDPLIKKLISIGNINKEFEDTINYIMDNGINENEALKYLEFSIHFTNHLYNYYVFESFETIEHLLGDDILAGIYTEEPSNNNEEMAERLDLENLKKVFLLRHYKAKLEDLREFIIKSFHLIKFVGADLYVGQNYICTVDIIEKKDARRLINELLVNGVRLHVLEDYLKANLEILWKKSIL